jgi:hypothetical protein
MMVEDRLKVSDTQTRAWQLVKQHATRRAAELRSKLESQINWDDTMMCRAQLREIKAILELEEPIEAQYVEQEID